MWLSSNSSSVGMDFLHSLSELLQPAVLEWFISTSGEATSACKPFWHNGWGNSGMNECRKSIPTQELLQENHSLMFWQFGKNHTSTCALKLSSTFKIMISYPMLIWQVFLSKFTKTKLVKSTKVNKFEKKNLRKFHTHTSAQKLSSKRCNLTSFHVKFKFMTFLRQNFLNCDRKTGQINAVG